MTTTQTQVTGPVDDAIDAEVDRLIDCAQTWAMNVERGNTITACTDKDEAVRLARSITARLAPRADALIEREQVKREIAKCVDDRLAWIHDLNRDSAVDALTSVVMALLPRAPMPDVVTMRERAAKWIAIQDGIRWDHLTDDMKADWFPLADELLATLFNAEVGS